MERFWEKVNKTKSCWLWQSTITRGGYGQFVIESPERVLAHRFAYELLKGKIPEGLALDHVCRNRSCVNPDHLEPVTQKENILRGIGPAAINKRKTHCIRGHEFKIHAYVDNNGRRICSECKRIATRLRRQRYPNLPREPYNPKARHDLYMRKTKRCKNGHSFTKANTKIAKDGRRICKICKKITHRQPQK